MADQDTPSRASNMEKAEGDRQDKTVGRHWHPAEERTSDNSTVENGGVSTGREQNPALPADDSTLRTEI